MHDNESHRFIFEDLIARGAFARVYRGRDAESGDVVAIKVLDLHAGYDADVVERFVREAELAAQLKHPGIAPLLGQGLTENMEPYFVTHLLQGRTLRDELADDGPQSPVRAGAIVAEALDAVASAHDQGVLHRDIKPTNLFIGPNVAPVMVLDFGLALTILDEGGRLTADGSAVGTPSYMAPEYITDGKVSAAMDIYALGLVLCEAATGNRVVVGDRLYDCYMAHTRGLKVPSELRKTPLYDIAEKAIDTAPTRRFSSARRFRQAIVEAFGADALADALADTDPVFGA